MTEIDFYFHVEDKLKTACALSAKACARGLRVYAWCGDEDTSRRFDRMLWATPPTGFTPHCAPDHPLAGVTPVVIGVGGVEPPHDQVLINLDGELPEYFSRFERVVEIVSLDEEDRRAARARFKFYRDRGYEIRSHDLSQKAS